jgi:hypothetical protein
MTLGLRSYRALYVNWDELTDIAVCEFREAAADLDDPRVRALIDGA